MRSDLMSAPEADIGLLALDRLETAGAGTHPAACRSSRAPA